MNRPSFALLLLTASYSLIPLIATAQSTATYSVGPSQLCMIDGDGQVNCNISQGFERISPPASLPAMMAVTAGDVHACGITLDGEAICWGSNNFGQLDIPDTSLPLVKINAGANHTCALDTEGQAICWGLNDNRQTEPPAGARFIEIDAASNFSCGILENGSITCWTTDTSVAQELIDGPFTDLDLRIGGVCGLMSDGTIECFQNSRLITAAPPGDDYIDVAANSDAVCGLTSDGTLECTFRNVDVASDYPLGEQFLSIQSNETETGFIQIFRNGTRFRVGSTMCGERPDGTIECWAEGANFPDLNAAVTSTLDLVQNMEFDLDARIYDGVGVEIFWTPLATFEDGRLTVFPPRVEIYRNDELIDSVQARFSYFDRLATGDLEYQIRLIDNVGNAGDFSGTLSVNTDTGTVLFNGEPPILPSPVELLPDVFFTAFDRVGLSNGFISYWTVDPALEEMVDGYIVEVDGVVAGFTRLNLFVSVSGRVQNCVEVAAIGFDGSVIGRRGSGSCI